MNYVTLPQIHSRLPDLGTDHDTILAELIVQASSVVDTLTHRPDGFGMTAAVRLFDGSGTNKQRVGDIVSVSLLRVRSGTTGTWTTLASTDYRLRPSSPMQPARWLEIVDGASGPGYFVDGYDTVEVTGTWGWPAVPKAIEVATAEITVQNWRSRGAGVDQFGISEIQQPGVPRALPALAYHLLRPFTKLVYA